MVDLNKCGFATKQIHCGKQENSAGALTIPIYQTSTFEFASVEQGGRRFAGQEAGYIYTRLGNPTVTAVEEKVAALEGGEAAVGTGSGMGAISAALWSLVEAGDEILKAYTQLKEVRENRLRLEKEEDALTETLKVFCSDADTITYEGSVLATWKQGKDSSKFDKDAFARENPELYAKYVKIVGGGRRFSLK